MIVWEPTFVLIALLIAGLLLTRSTFSALAFSIFGLYTSAALAVVVGIITSPEARKSAIIVIAFSCLLISIVYVLKTKKFAGMKHWIWAGVFAVLSIASQIVSRSFGLSSVAFGDGHTIMGVGQVFQGYPGEVLGGTKALKRGFGLPALQSFGFDREYLVGFLPIFFIAALILTLYLLWLISPTKPVFLSVTSVTLAIVVSTEAIMRHLYLMNTHATAWLLTSFFLIMVWKHLYSEVNPGEVVTILLAFSAIAFMRFDFILLFAPYLLVFLLTTARQNKFLAIGSLFAVAVPAWLWMTLAVSDFPFFGSAGPSLLAIIGVALGTAIVLTQDKLRRPIVPLTGISLLVLASFFSFALIVFTNLIRSLENVFTNLFLGEGLWGFSFWILTFIALVSLLAKRTAANMNFNKAAVRLFTASISLYIFTKFLDGDLLWEVGTSWSRIGFGDSLNRTLVTWLPFFLIPVVKMFTSIFPLKIESNQPRNSKKQRR
jgi:hypothetical protein